jgi:allantoinase
MTPADQSPVLPSSRLPDSVLRGRRVLTPEGLRPASIYMDAGRVTRLASFENVPAGVVPAEAGDSLVMPGLVDSHVHVNEPGRTEWEGFATAGRAALAGGITTICDMPLNSIPATTTRAALELKQRTASNQAAGTVAFIGGVVPGNSGELEGLRDAGACAFKCFLSPSGVPEFPSVSESDLRQAFPVLATLGLTLMVHAEDPVLLRAGTSSRRYADYLASRPVEAEHSAIALLVRLLERCPTPVHVVHLSSATSLALLRTARAHGLPLTVETCPHYLSFAAEEIPDGATEYKCAPPIRGRAEREALWRGLLGGEIDLVASDHSPCPTALKQTEGDFFSAWGGIASLQLALPAVWTGLRARGGAPERLAEWMSAAPARLVGLNHRKGALSAGYDADIVVWDPEATFVVNPALLLHRHPTTPYAGRELFGVVRATFTGGRLAFGSL